MLTSSGGARRALPSVDRLLRMAAFVALAGEFGRPLLLEALRTVLAEQRALLAGSPAAPVPDAATLALLCREWLAARGRRCGRFSISRATVLHTNLGRALLAEQAIEAAVDGDAPAVKLEYELEGGARGERDAHVEPWLCRLTGAEAATVVNNNAAAVLLALNALAAGREVIVSRGELIEIGGAFRIPDIMARAGARLRRGRHHQPHPSRATTRPRSARRPRRS